VGAQWWWVLGTGFLHVAYFMVLLRGYRLGDLSVVYPVARGTGPLLAAAGAILWLGERATALSIAGALLITIGVLVLTLRSPRSTGGSLPRGLEYGLLTGALIGAYTLWDGYAVKRMGLSPLFYYWAGEMFRVVLYLPAAARDGAGFRTVWREHWLRVLGIAALSPLSYLLILLALRRGAVGHVAPARELSILIGAWLGGHVLGEGDRRRRLVAAAAFAGGVVALTLA
jgi:drug/metabolite transporter (DMT)-like permease